MKTRFKDTPIELTDQERKVLRIIAAAGVTKNTATGPYIFSAMASFGFDPSSVNGMHRTAASLCRKKLAERLGTSRLMWYGITPLGREVLRRGR